MRLYFEVARKTFARIATYRQATLAGVFTNTVFGFVLAYVLLAVYQERETVGGFDATDAVTFTFVGQGLLMVVGIFGSTDIAERIRTGDVVVDLQRPYDQQAWWAAVSYGNAAYYAIFRGIPPFVIGAIVFDLRTPSSPNFAAFVVSVWLALAVCFAWTYMLQLSAFWLMDFRGPYQIGIFVAQFFSGALIPIVFFPSWLETTTRALPFPSMMQLPIEVWLGRYHDAALLGVFAQQVLWACFLIVAGRFIMSRAVGRIVVQGG